MRVDGNKALLQITNQTHQVQLKRILPLFNRDHRYEPYRITGLVARHRPNHPNDDFTQPGILFRKIMNEKTR